MLVITRKPEERIIINDQISIVVLEADHQRVKIGIEAPKEISIYRQELYEAIQFENRLAVEKSGEFSLFEQWMSRMFKRETGKEVSEG